MHRPLVRRIRRHIKNFRKKIASKALILMYHRVSKKDVDPWSLNVSPEHFAEQQEVLRKEMYPISLNQLAEAHKKGRVPDKAVAITFDDGYADNLHIAKPLLEEYSNPATVFVPSGKVNKKREFWWDELERIFLQPGILPNTLNININGKTIERDLGEDASYSMESFNKYRDWIVYSEMDCCLRQSIYLEFHQLLQPLAHLEQQKILDDLRVWSDVKALDSSTHRTLSIKELLSLKKGGLIDIGAHTITHSFLSAHPEHLQLDEIRRSKLELEEVIGQPVRGFAYPYGNYTKETTSLVQKSGFEYACSTVNDWVWSGSNRFLLPRLTVQDWDGEQFAEWLSQLGML